MKHEIRLYGPIGGWFGFTADEIIRNIPENATEIIMRIHSPGGDVAEGLAIFHALKDHPAHVTTIVDGYAASSASFLMLVGDDVLVHRNSIVFVHNPWTCACGDASELRKTANGLDVHAEAILDIYMQHTGMSEDALREMMDEAEFFRGVDAVEKGFATEVIDNPEAEAQIAAMLDMDALYAQHKEKAVTAKKTRTDISGAHEVTIGQLATAQATIKENAQAARDSKEKLKIATNISMALSSDLNTIKAERDGLLIDAEAHEKSITAMQVEVTAAKNDKTQAEEKAASYKIALGDPTLSAAAKQKIDKDDLAAADIEAETSEKEARQEKAAADSKPKNVYEEYMAMEPGKERQKFLGKNENEIMKGSALVNSQKS